jgi:hypothetical protein
VSYNVLDTLVGGDCAINGQGTCLKCLPLFYKDTLV